MAETIRGINIKLNLDGKDLKNELNEIKANLKEQQKDLKAINTSLKYDPNNLSLWNEKQAKLNSILEDTKRKLANQNEQLNKAKKALEIGEISEKEYNQLRRSVKYTESDINKLNTELKKTKDNISKLSSINLDKFSKFGSDMTKFVTAPILAGVSAITLLSSKSAQMADDLGDTASKLGISVKALQEWNYTAKILAVENEQLQKAFIKTNGVLGELASGTTNSATEALTKLGLSYDDLKGKSNDEAFRIIRDALSNVEDATLRVGLANDIFGEKLATNLMQVLSAESSEIDKLINECNELGIVTEEQAKVSGEFNDSIDKLKTSLGVLGVEIAVVVLPSLTKFLEKVRSELIPKISEWTEKITNLSSGTKKAIVIILGLVASIGPLIKIITSIIKLSKVMSVALHGVGTSGFFAGAGLSAMTLGIGALVALLITALTQSEQFKEIIHGLGQAIMDLLSPIWEIINVLGEVLMPIFKMVIDVVTMALDLLMPLLHAVLKPIFNVLSLIGDIIKQFMPLFVLLGNLISKVINPVLQVLYSILEPIFFILNKIIEAVTWILDHTVGWLLDIVDAVVGWFTGGDSKVEEKGANNVSNNTNNVTNNVTINTSSSEFDVDSINRALGDNYL